VVLVRNRGARFARGLIWGLRGLGRVWRVTGTRGEGPVDAYRRRRRYHPAHLLWAYRCANGDSVSVTEAIRHAAPQLTPELRCSRLRAIEAIAGRCHWATWARVPVRCDRAWVDRVSERWHSAAPRTRPSSRSFGPAKISLPVERPDARTLAGLRERILQRFLWFAAFIVFNHQLGRSSRALVDCVD
jgi:hypothetical protein